MTEITYWIALYEFTGKSHRECVDVKNKRKLDMTKEEFRDLYEFSRAWPMISKQSIGTIRMAFYFCAIIAINEYLEEK
ncbi:MAG: hypothetical protein PHO15_03575 [Eubacteriales bacterium]|nr:hypothetical protein [Eubacteriales bacterium]